MIEVREEDRKFLRFLWWKSDGQLLTYQHCRVVVGVNCSAFILGAVLNHHLDTVEPEDKSTADKLMNSMYVDNAVLSLDSFDKYEEFRRKSVTILARAGMELRQWEHSSVEEPRIGLLSSRCGLGTDRRICKEEPSPSRITFVLGLKWDKNLDTLSCDLSTLLPEDFKITKRGILATIARIFDPIGFTSPAVIIPKLILRET